MTRRNVSSGSALSSLARCLLIGSLALGNLAAAQPSFPHATPIAVPLTPDVLPLAASMFVQGRPPAQEQWARIGDDRMARNVTAPTLEVYRAHGSASGGTSIIVAPGGAFMALSMDNEGSRVAQRLADHGITAFLLKYRVDETPPDEPGFEAAIGARVGASSGGSASQRIAGYDPEATTDALAAIRLVRNRAKEWGLAPDRVGFLGFSAGAELARRVALDHDARARPNFVAMIYGPTGKISVPADAPPLFAALAADDPIFGADPFGLVESWRAAGRPVEFHLFEQGGHGFGVRRQGLTSDLWDHEFMAWLAAHKWVSPDEL